MNECCPACYGPDDPDRRSNNTQDSARAGGAHENGHQTHPGIGTLGSIQEASLSRRRGHDAQIVTRGRARDTETQATAIDLFDLWFDYATIL